MKRLILWVVLMSVAGWWSPAHAAISCGTPTTNTVAADPQSVTYTPDAGANRVLLVFVSAREDTNSIVGVSSSAGGTFTAYVNVSFSTGQTLYGAIFYSTDFADGSQTISADFSNSMLQSTVAVVTCTGVRVSNPWRAAVVGASSTGTSVSTDVTSVAGDVVVDVLAVAGNTGDDAAVGANQTAIIDQNVGGVNLLAGASKEPATGATTTMSWSWTNNRQYIHRAGALVPADALGQKARKPVRF